MLKSKKIIKYLSNLPGWRTNRKIVVFESDDWGSIRMPSRAVFDELVKKGLTIKEDPYCLYDSLERNQDLENLFDVLSKHRDKNGNTPVFTGLCLPANPDFEKIEASDFSTYYYESLSKTIERYHDSNKVLSLWKEGMKNRLFIPEFHGREHLNVQQWIRDLQKENTHTRLAFEHRLWGVYSPIIEHEYQAAFDLEFPSDLNYQKTVLSEGIDLLTQLTSYKPRFFVPTNGPFNLSLIDTLYKKGIKYILLDKFQKEPLGNGKFKRHIRFLGKRNKLGQIYLSRNCIFEPSQFMYKDNINSCMNDIELAFKLKKPATISSHRVNYIGTHDETNAYSSLKSLEALIKEILKRWPEVEFMSSSELGKLISEKH